MKIVKRSSGLHDVRKLEVMQRLKVDQPRKEISVHIDALYVLNDKIDKN